MADPVNRSTQSLVGRPREETDWERVSQRFSRSLPTRYRRDSLTREETADLDDLVYALNRGMGVFVLLRFVSKYRGIFKSVSEYYVK